MVILRPTVLFRIFVWVLVATHLGPSPGMAREASGVVAAKLQSFVELQLPLGDGPHPLVVLNPGCLGWHPHHQQWRAKLIKKGFAVVLVDSFAARGLTTRTQLENVCSGASIPGSQRAGDLMAVLPNIWSRPDIQPDKTVMMGWSHGGWTAMDFLIMAANKILPPNLSSMPPINVNNISAAFLFYPYCGFGSLSGEQGFPASVVVRVYHGTADRITSPSACRARVDALASSGANIRFFPQRDAGHWFDNFAERQTYNRSVAARVESLIDQELERLER